MSCSEVKNKKMQALFQQ